jgi:hypothetical protein
MPAPGLWSLMRRQQDISGLMYRRNRHYDPMTGQFTQSDGAEPCSGSQVGGSERCVQGRFHSGHVAGNLVWSRNDGKFRHVATSYGQGTVRRTGSFSLSRELLGRLGRGENGTLTFR